VERFPSRELVEIVRTKRRKIIMTIESNTNNHSPYDFEFYCKNCGVVWDVNTRELPFEEREAFLKNQTCPHCKDLNTSETDESATDWESESFYSCYFYNTANTTTSI
jgi:transcription initiation factor IIE alpha subunit